MDQIRMAVMAAVGMRRRKDPQAPHRGTGHARASLDRRDQVVATADIHEDNLNLFCDEHNIPRVSPTTGNAGECRVGCGNHHYMARAPC